MYQQLELQLFAQSNKAGTMDVEKIDRKFYQCIYWNHVNDISAIAFVKFGEGVHLMDFNNPYDNEADRKAVEGMKNLKFYTQIDEIPF